MSVRHSYRARLSVVPLDARAEAMLRAADHAEELNVVPLGEGTVEAAAGTDMVLFLAADAAAVDPEGLNAAAAELRRRGLLVGGAVTGAIAVDDGTGDERRGLAALREAVDMLVVVRDDALVMDLLDVLRGGRMGVPSADG